MKLVPDGSTVKKGRHRLRARLGELKDQLVNQKITIKSRGSEL